MARTKKQEQTVHEFKFYDDDPSKNKGMAPQVRGRRQVVNNPEARSLLSTAIGEFRNALQKPKVNSNAELIERLDEYFKIAQEREMPPTIEEMALFCGYTPRTLWDWKTGRRKGFSDMESGFTTAEILQKSWEVLHGTDVVLAATRKMDAAVYIWRGKNWYNEKDVQEVVVQSDNGMKPALTPEEIVKNLPEPTNTDDLPTDYTVE